MASNSIIAAETTQMAASPISLTQTREEEDEHHAPVSLGVLHEAPEHQQLEQVARQMRQVGVAQLVRNELRRHVQGEGGDGLG